MMAEGVDTVWAPSEREREAVEVLPRCYPSKRVSRKRKVTRNVTRNTSLSLSLSLWAVLPGYHLFVPGRSS